MRFTDLQPWSQDDMKPQCLNQDEARRAITWLIGSDCAGLHVENLELPPLISWFCSPLNPYKNLCLHWEVEMGFVTWAPHLPGGGLWDVSPPSFRQPAPANKPLSFTPAPASQVLTFVAAEPAFHYNGRFKGASLYKLLVPMCSGTTWENSVVLAGKGEYSEAL